MCLRYANILHKLYCDTIINVQHFLLWPVMQKNRILAKNRQYAKTRENENSRTLAKSEWTIVQSLLLLGYCDFTKNCSTAFFIGIQKDFLILLLLKKMTVSLKHPKMHQNGQFWEFEIFFGGQKNFLGQKCFSEFFSHFH